VSRSWLLRRRGTSAEVLVAALTFSLFAALPEPTAPPEGNPPLPGAQVRNLPVSYWVDGAIIAAAGLSWIATDTFLFNQLAPTQCRWCDRAADSADKLNGVDAWARGARWSPSQQGTANGLSSVIAFGILPASALALDFVLAAPNQRAWVPGDLLIVGETATLATLIDQTVKFLSARQRPFAHFQPTGQPPASLSGDANLSFFSGHATVAFALAVSLGTVSQMRGYRWAWLVWAIGVPLAASVAYLRMAADVHYLSDVLVGSAVGALCGYGLPTLLHHPSKGSIQIDIAPGPTGAAVKVTF
jgi:hypothetical protein